MKKILIKFTLAAALLAAPLFSMNAQEGATSDAAQAAEVEVEQEVVTAVKEGDNVIITLDGTDYTMPADEYEAEIARGLTPKKIANNKRISEADSSGIGVTIMAMCIVLGALIVLSILFMCFGKLFTKSHSKRKREAQGIEAHEDDDDLAHGEVIAAIAAALDEHFNSRHDIEDTVLTIRRMKRAYSPWNSKIYNMREVPTLRRNRK